MAQRQYSEEEKQIFYHEIFFHPHPRVQLKMEVMWLKSQGIKNSQIARLTKVCENTVRKYIKDYEEGGIDKLK
jgi:DNA-binding NarL/FixJ family response regulator